MGVRQLLLALISAPPPEGTPLKLEAYPPPLVQFSAMFNLRNTSSRGKPEVDQELVVECLSLVVEYLRLLVETVETGPLALVGCKAHGICDCEALISMLPIALAGDEGDSPILFALTRHLVLVVHACLERHAIDHAAPPEEF